MELYSLFDFIEDCMGKRVSPLQAGRNRLRPNTGTMSQTSDLADLAYPFSEISPRLKVNISKRARRMALRLDAHTRQMLLVVPQRASLKSAFRFAEENQEWIREKLRALPRPVALRDGAVIPVFGKDRRIVVLYNPALKFTDIQLRKDELIVTTNKADPSLRIRRFLMEEAKRRLTTMAEEKAALIRRRVIEVQVKDTKSRWGSCADNGYIAFSWRLIFAPLKAIDYVVAHEVAHLAHMDHSGNFWRVCEELSWDFDEGKGWMDANGHELMRYGQ